MVSQYTWPNFRGGADRDGVRILIQQQNFDEDVVYGKTKIFVRSPQTLFMLEQVSLKLFFFNENNVLLTLLLFHIFRLALVSFRE
jgi:hypothetical protein